MSGGSMRNASQSDSHVLELEDYRGIIHLDEPYSYPVPSKQLKITNDELNIIVGELVEYLRSENLSHSTYQTPTNATLREELYSLLTLRPPNPLPKWFYKKIDSLLHLELHKKSVVKSETLSPISPKIPVALWQGDITTIQIDAIINAANSQLLGCFIPYHKCIDNVIHAAAGPLLRQDCHKIMVAQGFPEPPGQAKITRGYNLPSKYVLHTVGPIYNGSQDDYINDRVISSQQNLLQSSYQKCLEVASNVDQIQSLAFCGISTGVYGFPKRPAARIAIETITKWLRTHPKRFRLIVIDVFSNVDKEIYKQLL